MPGPYGKVSNPVVLDPFRTIVEVHWPRQFDYIAFAIRFSSADIINEDLSCTGSGVPFPTGGGPHWRDWLSVLGYLYVPGSPTIWGGRNTDSTDGVTWSSPSETVEVSDKPDLPDFAFADWEKVGGAGGFGDGVTSWIIFGHKGRIMAPAGSEMPIAVPGALSEHFHEGTTVDIDSLGDTFTGDPFCIDSFTTSKWATCTGDTDPAGYTNASSYAAFAFDFSTMTVVHHGDTFVPVGTAVLGGDAFAGGRDFGAGVWLLFQREEPTA